MPHVACTRTDRAALRATSPTVRPVVRLGLLVVASALLGSTLYAQGRVLTVCQGASMERARTDGCQSRVYRVATSTLVEVTDRIARTTITETFENRGGRLGQADFLFPMPRGAAFEDLRLEIDGKLVAGEVLDASSARETYERIVREKRDPALVEWAGLGLLRTRIFPFDAGARRTVVVRYREVLTRDGDALRVGGRLAGVEDVTDERGSGTFRVRWSDDAVGTPWSPTHAVRLRAGPMAGGTREATLSGSTGDVLVYLPVRSDVRTPTVTVLTHVDRDGDRSTNARDERHALVIVTPPRQAPTAMPRDITMAIDVSGSMKGTKLSQAVAAGHALLATLTAEDRFQLVAFADDVERHAPALVRATPDARRSAGRWLDGLEARGGTNIGDAMRSTLGILRAASRDDSRLPLSLLLTDGQPTIGMRGDEILDSTVVWRGDARVFTFGVGEDVDATLVEQLALGGRGSAQFVRPEESVERAVSLVAQRLAAPLLANVQVTMDGGTLRQLYAPNGVDLMAGQELVFLARYTGASTGRVRVTGTNAGASGTRTRASTTSYTFATREDKNGFVPRLWAVQRVAALDAERRRRGPSSELDDEMRTLGNRYGVPTPLTSYLVLEPDARVADRHAVPTRVMSPGPTGRGGVSSKAAGGGASALVAPASAAPPAAVAFEQARMASAQRAVANMSAADAALGSREAEAVASGRTRVVGGLVFDRVGSTWVDRRLTSEPTWKPTQRVRVQPFSPAWLALGQAIPELRDALALGEAVRVRGRTVLVEVAADGVTSLDTAALRALASGW